MTECNNSTVDNIIIYKYNFIFIYTNIIKKIKNCDNECIKLIIIFYNYNYINAYIRRPSTAAQFIFGSLRT